jgi:UDP-GlcNAc:undecaprenyl-phosphate GlcNAc-1-phosphate transferase
MIHLGIVSMIVAMGVTSLLTPSVIRLAHRLGAMDLPGGRKVHGGPIPRIGGVAVFAGFVAGLGSAAFLAGFLFEPIHVHVYWPGLVIAETVIFLVGLADDLWGLRYYWKFAAQISCAVYVWYIGFRVDKISQPLVEGGDGTELVWWLSLLITVLWIVAITNAVNLIDGLDGLAAGTALITTLATAVIAFKMRNLGVAAACVALAGSLLGFLRFNFSPAQIFLGDSGSMFLGFVLAVASARGSQKLPTIVVVLVPLLVLALPLIDTGLAVIRRLYRLSRRGRQSDRMTRYVLRNLNHVFLPDRDHIHHRLIDSGLSHRGAVLILYGVGLASALVAFVLTFVNSREIGFLLLGILVGTMAALLGVLYFRVRRIDRGAGGTAGPDSDPPAGDETWEPRRRQAPTR